MSKDISMSELARKRKENCFNEAKFKYLKSTLNFDDDDRDEALVVMALKGARELDSVKYLSNDQIRELTELTSSRLKAAIFKADKHFLNSEGLCVTNMFGVGYKIATDEQATMEATKAAKRAFSDAKKCIAILENTSYDFAALKEKSPIYAQLWMATRGVCVHLKHLMEASEEVIEFHSEQVKELDGRAAADVERPSFRD